MPRYPHSRALAAAVALLGLAGAPAAAVAAGSEPCLDCHAELEGETLAFPDGSTIDVGVDPETLAASVHREHRCVDCHRTIAEHPHPAIDAPGARAWRLGQARTCVRCHYAYYTRNLDGIHYRLLAAGREDAPTCVDCHGAHAVTSKEALRGAMDPRCTDCHAEIAAQWRASVHGQARGGSTADDVPACVDCHGAHAIADPREPAFRTSAHQICIRCHSDPERMGRHGLSAEVGRTYLDDFHGASNALYAAGGGSPGKPMATCTDCHGIHDIERMDRAGTPATVRARVASLCRDCHDEVPDRFADAWLRHYPPTLSSAPLVWAVQWAYRLLIPFIVSGLAIHLLLHLWHWRASRKRRAAS